MRAFATLLRLDLRRQLRSGFVLAVGIAAPLALSFVLNLVFGGATSGRLEIPVGVLDEDRTEVSAGLVEALRALEEPGLVELTVLDAGVDPAAVVDDGDQTSVLVVPAGYGATFEGGGAAPEVRLVEADDAPTTTGIVRAVVEELLAGTDRTRLAVAAASELGVDAPPAVSSTISVEDVSAGERLDAGAALTASMAVLFLFFTAIAGVGALLEERAEGTLDRVLAAPVRPSTVLVEKVAVSVLLGALTTSVLLAAATVLLGAEWGSPAGALLLVLGASAAAAGATLLIVGLSSTMEGALATQSVVAFVLALLGGSLLPLPSVPVLDALARLTPHHWLIEGLAGQVSGTGTPLLVAFGALVAFAVATTVPGVVLAQRKLVP